MKSLTKCSGIIAIGMVIVLALHLTACATSVPISSVRPPTIDTSTVQRLAIRDFQNKSGTGGAFGAQITQYLTDQSKQIIPATGYFTIVAPTDPNADGVFAGEIRAITVNQTQSEPRERKDKDGNTYIEITYNREVSLEFQYSIVSSRTGMPVGTITKKGSQSDSQTEQSRLADQLTLAKRVVDSQLRSLKQDTVPTIVNQNINLMNETSKDKAAKQRMKEAQALVKNKNYDEAIRLYDAIGTSAARNNADLLRRSIESDIAAKTQLAALFSDTGGLAEKAAKGAVDALYSKLTNPGTVIIITKERSTDRERLDYVVDQMDKIIIQDKKLTIVDRSNQNLIKAEQDFQTSGEVSEKSMVSVGKQLGAQYIVFCAISGQASTRQLNLRVVSIETAAIIDRQSFDL